jgi:predicted acylesterase/phospholipase RssA
MTQLGKNEKADIQAPGRELRLGLVFFGGVSLAIYENGVARALYDLVQGRSIFKPLLELLDTRAVVDVMAGTSAGGINGLMLAAALESGYEFKRTAEKWRDLGDLGALLRDVSSADKSESLLKGKEYYLKELRAAFLDICNGGPNSSENQANCPKEMDLFITGTDMVGEVRERLDALDSKIPTKQHRTIFHLKHRSGRRRLGLPNGASNTSTQQQADILAAVARITSSFPFAFPPFTVEEFDEDADAMAAALYALATTGQRTRDLRGRQPSNAKKFGCKAFMDGGVLDNKPFTPALRAIFYRMPETNNVIIDRKLFYVEPDPEEYSIKKKRSGAKDGVSEVAYFSPLQVGAAVVNLPMYDSIEDDLRSIDEHNAKIERFKELRKVLVNTKADGRAGANPLLYERARQDAMSRKLWPDVNTQSRPKPAVLTPMLNPEVKYDDDGLSVAFDVSFHLRRAFYLMYECGEEIERRARAKSALQTPSTADDYVAVGRWIKALKVIDDTSDRLVLPTSAPEESVARYRAFLTDSALVLPLRQLASAESVVKSMNSDHLTALYDAALSAVKTANQTSAEALANRTETAADSVLFVMERLARSMLSPSTRDYLEAFTEFDRAIFPLEHAAELRELDTIQLVRISPKDAPLPLGVSAEQKVAGDTLAHFSAFLRRDWRSNDIAWGHCDGLCQVVRTLLCTEPSGAKSAKETGERELVGFDLLEARLRKGPTRDIVSAWFEQGLDDLFEDPAAAAATKARLRSAWKNLLDQVDCGPCDDACRKEFLEAMVEAGQESAAAEYVELIKKDAQRQNNDWSWKEGPERMLEGKSRLQQLTKLRIGSEPLPVAVPPGIRWEYGSLAVLHVLGMLGKSLKGKAAKAFETVRPLPRLSAQLIHSLSVALRTQRSFGLILAVGFLAALGGVALSATYTGALGLALLSFLVFAISAYIVHLLLQRCWFKLGAIGVGAAILVLAWFFSASLRHDQAARVARAEIALLKAAFVPGENAAEKQSNACGQVKEICPTKQRKGKRSAASSP